MKHPQKIIKIIGIVTTLGLSLPIAAHAQDADSARHNDAGRGRRMMHADPAAQMDKLKAKLKITADQESAWQSFAGIVKQQSESMKAWRKTTQDTPQTAPDRMDRQVELMKQREAGMETVAKAMRQLYAVLTPEQKAVLDKRANRHHG
jgi:periplasmic protein CpxP/Spy